MKKFLPIILTTFSLLNLSAQIGRAEAITWKVKAKNIKIIIHIAFMCCTILYGTAQDFAIIGDYGTNNITEFKVSQSVKNWQPDFILTVGDNNYDNGSASTIDANIGKYYSEYIYPYKGDFGQGASINKFFPSPGNHDYNTEGAIPYYDYFELPGNERYYDFIKGDVHFFAMNSNSQEPDGNESDSKQANWLREKLANSDSKWKIVYLHHAAYSSGVHGSSTKQQWPYAEWGATAVVYGHDHHYERLQVNGIPHFVTGSAGQTLRALTKPPLLETKFRYNENNGAMFVSASNKEITFEFRNINNDIIDTHTLNDEIAIEDESNEVLIKYPQSLKIYPNPISNNKLTINFFVHGSTFFEYSIFDIVGKPLVSETIAIQLGALEHTIDAPQLETLKSGIYFLKVKIGDLQFVNTIVIK